MQNMRRSALALTTALFLLVAATGCGDILEVDNPNSLIEEDLNNPSAANAMTNGVEASLTRALGAILAPYSTATGELAWIGSRNGWGQLDIGTVSDPGNEFTDAAFPYVAEARWQADDFIDRLETFRSEGTLPNDRDLGRLYLYGAIAYTTIADMFENYPIDSEGREGAPPVGEENMVQLYSTALTYIDNGLPLVESGSDLEATLLGMRARILHSRAVWQKVNPSGQVNTSNPLVGSTDIVSAAQAALDAMSDDFVYELELTSSSPGLVVGDLSMALQVNDRAELGFGPNYVRPNDDGTYTPNDNDPEDGISAVIFEDPITEEVHPHVQQTIDQFVAAGQFADIPVVTAREMHLILAEAALAGVGSVDFATQVNAVRSLDGLPAYDGSGDAAFERELLINSRQANLYLQGRRLADHYRFEDAPPEWTGSRDTPGTFFPITITEIRANPNITQ
jgi:hypothetical protein